MKKARFSRKYGNELFKEDYVRFGSHYVIQKTNEFEYIIYGEMDWWQYIFLIIPITIINFFKCAWNEGIKHFEFEHRDSPYIYKFIWTWGENKYLYDIFVKKGLIERNPNFE